MGVFVALVSRDLAAVIITERLSTRGLARARRRSSRRARKLAGFAAGPDATAALASWVESGE